MICSEEENDLTLNYRVISSLVAVVDCLARRPCARIHYSFEKLLCSQYKYNVAGVTVVCFFGRGRGRPVVTQLTRWC